MLVYIDDREDEELTDDYGYDYGCEEEDYEYNSDSNTNSYEKDENARDSYFD